MVRITKGRGIKLNIIVTGFWYQEKAVEWANMILELDKKINFNKCIYIIGNEKMTSVLSDKKYIGISFNEALTELYSSYDFNEMLPLDRELLKKNATL